MGKSIELANNENESVDTTINSDSETALLLASPNNNKEFKFLQESIKNTLISRYRKNGEGDLKFSFENIIPMLTEGSQVIIQDEISLCFDSRPADRWNWNANLFLFWFIGVIIRYCILFPIRLLIWLMGYIVFFIGIFIVKLSTKRGSDGEIYGFRLCLRILANFTTFTWMSVIKLHGVLPKHKTNQIYVANHSSMIDYIILLTVAPFAVLGQRHPGWIGFFQKHLLGPLTGSVWFERDLTNDRKNMTQIVKKYITTKEYYKNRLLIFPEGTCVNTRYCIQFKRGCFALDSEICPIAIKYNESYSDAFWNSRKKSFARYIIDLLTSWTLVVDIYFLQPQTRKENESSSEFALRVRNLICRKARVKGVDWDGYLKYFKPAQKFLQYNQKRFSQSLMNKSIRDDKLGNTNEVEMISKLEEEEISVAMASNSNTNGDEKVDRKARSNCSNCAQELSEIEMNNNDKILGEFFGRMKKRRRKFAKRNLAKINTS